MVCSNCSQALLSKSTGECLGCGAKHIKFDTLSFVVGIVGIAIVCFAVALIDPVATGYLHHRADPTARATIESIEVMVQRVFTIGIGLVFGYLSTQYSIFTGFWMLGFVAVFASVIFSVFMVKA